MEDSKKLKLQDAKSTVADQKLFKIEVSKAPISSIAFSPDSQYIVTGSQDKTIRTWRRNGTLLRTITLPWTVSDSNNVSKVAISHNGQFIVSSNPEGRVQEWDFHSGQLRRTYKGHTVSEGVAISADDRDILSTGLFWDHDVRIWNRATGKCRILKGHTDAVMDVTISKDGKSIISCSTDGTLRVWELATGQLLKTLVWHNEIAEKKAVREISTLESTDPVSVSPDMIFEIAILPLKFATGFVLGNTKNEIRKGCKDSSVIISPDNRFVASNLKDSICLWNFPSGTPLKRFEGHFSSLAITPDGQYLISAEDKAVAIWNIKTGECLSAFTQHLPAGVEKVIISPDGTKIAAGDNEGNLHIWDFPPSLLLSQKLEQENSPALKIFIEVLTDPSKLTVTLLQKMLTKVNHIDEFRFAYTLVSIQLQQVPAHKDPLYGDIYKCLERLSETCVVGPSKDSKESSKQGADYIARYKLILETLCSNQIITHHQELALGDLAARNMVFSDRRFKEVEEQVQALKHQVELQQKNIELIAQDLNQLKQSLKAKADREFIFGVAKVATLFLANGLVDLLASALNMSDIAKTGAALLKINVKEWKHLVKQGAGVVKEHMTETGADLALRKAGFNPDDLVDIWVESSVQLQIAPVSSVNSSSSSSSSSSPSLDQIATMRATLKPITVASTSFTTSSPPQKPESKRPGNIAQNFATVKSPIISQPATLQRQLSESDLYPIHSAIKKNISIKIITYILNTGSDINAKNSIGKTPLTLAVEQKNLEIVKLLLSKSANINGRDGNGKSPVEIAAEQGSLDIVEFLFSQNAEGNRLHLIEQAVQNQPAPMVQVGLPS